MLDDAHVAHHVGSGAKPGPHVMLTVSDTGAGMDPSTQARVFEPFFTTKPKGKGTGLGLSTVLGIVEQSGGHGPGESPVGRGATSRIYLPRPNETPVAAPRPVLREPAPTRGSETILLVEDEGQLRVLASDILSNAGYQVIDAPNAAEAIRLSERHAGPIHLL